MPRVKRASTQKRKSKAAVHVLGAAGLGFSLVGGASASTAPTADIPQSDNSLPNQRFMLGEEEMADVSLATFYLFDKENVGGGGVQLARGCGGCGHGGGCGGGCRAGGGCGGCRVGGCGCRIGGCGGCRIGGCGGCGFGFGIIACIGCAGCAACAGCCLSWGACRLC